MTIVYTPIFRKAIKALLKKYPSLGANLEELGESLIDNPQQGKSLGKSCYKVRLAIASKKTGKSGGARVITCVRIVADTIYLLDIYDKADRSTINDKELDNLIEQIED
jgi:hypothetical protein